MLQIITVTSQSIVLRTNVNKLMAEKSAESDILPIEQQKIKSKIKHVVAIIPALDERWISDRRFAFYMFPPCRLLNGSDISGTKDVWLMSMSSVLDDVWWLCELQYHKFWSQILYNKNTMNGIRSFLHLAPLQRLYCKTEDEEISAMYKRIKKAVFQFLKRISRSKESEMHFMSNEKYEEIVTECDIMPMSLIFSISTIYGKNQTESVRIIISQLIACNKNLKFEQAVFRIVQLFGYLKKRLKASYRELRRNLIFGDDQNDFCNAVNSYRKCLLAISQFLANAAINISSFLSVYNDGSEFFLKQDFPFQIIRVYKKLLIPVYHMVDIWFKDSCHHQTYVWLSSVLDIARFELIKIFDLCLKTSTDHLSSSRTVYDVQWYVKLLKLSSKTKEFLCDLNCVSCVQEMTEEIKKICPGNIDLVEIDHLSKSISELISNEENENKDDSKNNTNSMENLEYLPEDILEYVKECYEFDENTTNSENKLYNESDTVLFNSDFSCSDSDWSDDQSSNSEYECYLTSSAEEEDEPVDNSSKEFAQFNSTIDFPSTSCVSSDFTISQVELQSAISHVKDLLPHLGDGFVAICLEYYKMDISAVINNILEDSLPTSLKSIDFSLSVIPRYVCERLTDLYETVSCDVNKRNETALKELKKPEYLSFNEMLNDKNEIRISKTIYERFKNVEDDEIYNDDVDEDYDELSVAPLEVATEGVYDKYNDFPIHNPNHMYSLQREEESSNTSEEENSVSINVDLDNSRKRLDFCENPEDVRARREHHRNVMQQRYNQKIIRRNENPSKNTNKRREGNTENRTYRNDDNQSNNLRYRSVNSTKIFKKNGTDEKRRRNSQYECLESGNHSKNFDHNENGANSRIRYKSKDLDTHLAKFAQHGSENSSQKYEPNFSSNKVFDRPKTIVDEHRMGNRRVTENSDNNRCSERYDKGNWCNANNYRNRKSLNKESESRGAFEELSKTSCEDRRHPTKTYNENTKQDREISENNGSRHEEDHLRMNNTVINDRRQKTIYKSRNGNHDRRFLADRKRQY